MQTSAGELALHPAADDDILMVHSKYKQRKPYGGNLIGGPGAWNTDIDAETELDFDDTSLRKEKTF